MKKVFFSLLLLQILILAGCQSFVDKEIPEAEVAEMPVDLLHQHAVDEISVEQDGNIYTIYLYSPDEADSNSDFGTYGHYELYVAQEESELATFQNTGYFLLHNMEEDTSYI